MYRNLEGIFEEFEVEEPQKEFRNYIDKSLKSAGEDRKEMFKYLMKACTISELNNIKSEESQKIFLDEINYSLEA